MDFTSFLYHMHSTIDFFGLQLPMQYDSGRETFDPPMNSLILKGGMCLEVRDLSMSKEFH